MVCLPTGANSRLLTVYFHHLDIDSHDQEAAILGIGPLDLVSVGV